MAYPFPPDLTELVQDQLATGEFSSEDDVLREAMKALAERRADVQAIQEGLADMDAGRVRPLQDVVDEIRATHGFAAET